MEQNLQPQLNEHNKEEYPPMHTTEHIVNQTMIRLFGCGRAVSAHIERKKSKLDLQALYSDHEEFFTDNRELGKSCRELLDTAACASDSVSGSEEVDAELQSNIMMLRGSVEAADAEATAKQIRRLLAIYNKRQALIRELR